MTTLTLCFLTCSVWLQDGETLLYCAVDNGHDKIVEMLIRAGANVNTDNKVVRACVCVCVCTWHVRA